MFVLTWSIALQSQRLCLEQGVATILYQYLATKLLTNSQVRIESFFKGNFDFDKSLTEKIDIKNIKCFSYVSWIYNTFWWVGIVTKVNIHEDDFKIEFLHPHGPRETSSWCHLLLINVLSQWQAFYALSQLQQQLLTLNKLWKDIKTIKCSPVYIKL